MEYLGNIDTDISIETRKLEDLGLQHQAAADTRDNLYASRQAASDIAYEAQERLQRKMQNEEITSLQNFREEESYVLFRRQKRDDYTARLDAAQAVVTRLMRVYSEQQKLVDDLKKFRHQMFMDAMRFEAAGDREQLGRRTRRRHGEDTSTAYRSGQAQSTQTFTCFPSFPERARAWYERTQPAIDYANMIVFPTPPSINAFGCQNVACKRNANILAPACKCSVRAAFEAMPGLNLKRERLRWHPDRFAVCKDRETQEMAKEVFVVVEGMYAGI